MFDQVQAAYNEFETAVTQVQAQARARLEEARLFALEAGIDLADLREFLQRPYLLRHIRDDRFELIVPKMVDLRAGWPARIDGQYAIYNVSRFIDLLTPLPDWLKAELNFEPPAFQITDEGDYILVKAGDAREAWDAFGGKKVFSSRRGNKLYLRPKSRFDVMRELVRAGILPYKPAPIPKHLLRTPKTSIQLRPLRRNGI